VAREASATFHDFPSTLSDQLIAEKLCPALTAVEAQKTPVPV
jgi:hypothetical protein